MPADSEKTRVYVSGRKAPIVVDAQFDAVVQNIRDAVTQGEPFLEFESAGRRFSEGRVAIRVEKIVGLREEQVVEEPHGGEEDGLTPEEEAFRGDLESAVGPETPEEMHEAGLGDEGPVA